MSLRGELDHVPQPQAVTNEERLAEIDKRIRAYRRVGRMNLGGQARTGVRANPSLSKSLRVEIDDLNKLKERIKREEKRNEV